MTQPLPRRGRRTFAGAGLGVLLLVAATGCFGGSSEGGEDRLAVAMAFPPTAGMSPLSDDATLLSRLSIAETLVQLDEDGNAQAMLATSWEQSDATTWTFDLRDDVTFHDDTALNADAVVGALTAAATGSSVPRILDGVGLQASVVDDDTVQLVTAAADPLLPNRLSSPQLAILAPSAYVSDGTIDPVGHATGPYVLSEVSTASATLERYDDYWDDTAAAEGVDVTFVPEGSARAAALRTGEADVAEAIPVGQTSELDDDEIAEVATARTDLLQLNTASGAFADPAVRAAARAAINPDALVEGVFEGSSDPADGLLGPALPWAADLREETAYTDALDQRVEPGDVDGVEITLATYTDRDTLPELAVLVQQQLEDAGFVVTQDVREYQYLESDALSGAFDAFIGARSMVLDSGDPVSTFASDYGCDGGYNIAQFCDTELDATLAEAATLDPGEERQQAIMLAEAEILAADAVVPLVYERVIVGQGTEVVDVAHDPFERRLVTAETVVE